MRRQQKIYDAGGERIVSQELTRSYGDANVDRGDYADAPHMDYAALRTSMEHAVKKAYEQLGVHYEGSDTVAAMTKPRKAGDLPGDSAVGEETRRFFYHKDHLGGTSIVTDKDGNAVQRLTYLPYGEVFTDALVDSSFVSPYKFTGKELDEETGLYYFGARYYNPKYVLWYGTDPLQEKYPWVSSYCYTMGNPVKLVDLEGEEPIYSKNGDYLGSSREGFTGQIYVYYGKEKVNFSKYEMKDLLKSGLATKFAKYENAVKALSEEKLGNFVSKVFTHMAKQFDGVDVFGNGKTFDFSTIKGGKIGYKQKEGTSFETYHSHGKIAIDANRPISPNYEATVENLMSSIIIHEWAGHGLLYYNDAKWFRKSKHHLAYNLVKQNNKFYYRTTNKYKYFINKQYNKYKNK